LQKMMKTIDFHSYIPYYRQLYSLLKDTIAKQGLKSGQMLPSESELCQQYGISRTVVRNALQDLESEGLIRRRKGKGSIVTGPKISEGLAQTLTGFYQDMAERGLATRTSVLLHETIPCPGKIASILNLAPQTPVIHSNRLRYVEGEPIALVTSYVPLQLCPALEHVDLTDRSLYEFLETTCGITIMSANRVLESSSADESQARHLEIEPGDPVMKLESISYLEDGTPVEYFLAFHRGDRTRFEINLMRVRDRWRLLGWNQPVDLSF
jgi:GntR family transcriptional regulator